MRLPWLAWRNLTHARARTSFLVLGLSSAVAVVLLLFGFTRDTYNALADTFARSGQGHVQVAAADWFDSPEPEQHRWSADELTRVQQALEARLGDRLLASTVRRDVTGMVAAGGRSGVFLGAAVDPTSDAAIAPLARPVVGTGLDAARPDAFMIGLPLAERLGVHTGDLVTVLVTTDQGLTNAADFEVSGLIRTGVDTLDRTIARLPLAPTMDLTGADTVDVLVLALKDTDDTDEALEVTREVLAEYPGLAARPWYEQASYYRAVKALYDRLFGVFQLLMLAVAGLSLSHAVAAVVAQRRPEIALLRVMGLKRRQVVGLFVLEGGLLGLFGGLGGVLLANLVAWLTAWLGGIPMPPPPGFADAYHAQFDLDVTGYALVLPTAVVVAMIASGAPAFGTARGALSRALSATVVLLALFPSTANAGDRLDRADSSWELPSEQVCEVQAQVINGTSDVRWNLRMQNGQTVGRTANPNDERAQAIWHTGATTWFQTGAMGKPIEFGGTQRLVGIPFLTFLGQPLAEQWVITTEEGDVVSVDARAGRDGPYASAVLVFDGDQLAEGSFAGPSGRVLHTATWTWSKDGVRVDVEDATARGGTWVVEATRPRCSPGDLEPSIELLGELLGGDQKSP